MTYVYFYRTDGKVQRFSHVGYCPPFLSAICIIYNGSDHYDALIIKSINLSPSHHLPPKKNDNFDSAVPLLPPIDTVGEAYTLKDPPEIVYNLGNKTKQMSNAIMNQDSRVSGQAESVVRDFLNSPEKNDIADRDSKETYKYYDDLTTMTYGR